MLSPSRLKQAAGFAFSVLTQNPSKPLYLIHFVTERCNANCSHCFLSENSVNELSLDEVREFTEKLGLLPFLTLTGGEPFLRSDLAEVIDLYCRNCSPLNVNLLSNGSLPARMGEVLPIVLEKYPKIEFTVFVSLDGLHGLHDEIRGFEGLFDKAVDSLQLLKELKGKHSNLDYGVITTLSALNANNFPEVHDFCLNTLDCRNHAVNLVRGCPTKEGVKGVDVSCYEKAVLMLSQERLKTWRSVKNRIVRERILSHLHGGRSFTGCPAGKFIAVLRSDGVVRACELLNSVFGSLRDCGFDIQVLWKSSNAEAVRRKIADLNCQCTHECFITADLIFNPFSCFKLFYKYLRLKVGL